MKKTAKILNLVFIILGLFFIFSYEKKGISSAEHNPKIINSKIYELSYKSRYEYDSIYEVNQMSFGDKNIGELVIFGNIVNEGSYNNVQAFETSGNIQISYNYNGKLQTNNKEKWNLVEDLNSSFNGEEIGASIGKGLLVLEKSYDYTNWQRIGSPIVNYFAKNLEGTQNLYSTEWQDIQTGAFYRISLAYKTGKKVGQKGMLWWKEDVFEYREHVEIYEFFLESDASVFNLKNLSLSDEDFQVEGFELEMMKIGETLKDGDITTKGFKIDTMGSNYTIRVSYNDEQFKIANHGDEFYNNGKYVIESISRIGISHKRTVYIFNGGEDYGFSTYFGTTLINGERIYNNNPNNPTYSIGSKLVINEVNSNTPGLSGEIVNLTTNEKILLDYKNKERKVVDLELGKYVATFYNGSGESGSFYKYVFVFEITDEKPIPKINYENLMGIKNLSSYNTKHYEVAYQTTLGGYIFVVFSLEQYEEAFSYAYEIEKRFIENTGDGLYYKSPNNPNQKVKYYNYMDLIKVLNEYARQNVEINYFNPLDIFTYRTYSDDFLVELEKINISESIKVFPNETTKQLMVSEKRYLNDFEFISVAPYESSKITAYSHVNGKTYNLQYNKNVSEQLNVSSLYTITEENIYGYTRTYDAYYINENETVSRWEVYNDGKKENVEINKMSVFNGYAEINADSVVLKSIINNFDEQAIFTIKAPNVYSFEIKGLLKELEQISLYKKGRYEISFIDRTGCYYKLIINISGNTSYRDLFDNNNDRKSFTDTFNNIFINSIDDDEEEIFTLNDLIYYINLEIIESDYTVASYSQYYYFLKEAIKVKNNENRTQGDLNRATQNLILGIEQLIVASNKNSLIELINLFDSLNEDEYISETFNALKKEVEKGIELLEDKQTTLEEINKSINLINAAYNKLLRKGDFTELQQILLKIKKINSAKYTQESIQKLNILFEEAYNLLKENDSTQIAIDDMIKKLKNQVKNLKDKAEIIKLYEVIYLVQNIDQSKYTSSSLIKLLEIYNEAILIYEDPNVEQNEVDKIVQKLSLQYKKLSIAGNDRELRSILNVIRLLEPNLYTKESIRQLEVQYNITIDIIKERHEQKVYDSQYIKLVELLNKLEINEYKNIIFNLLNKIKENQPKKISKKDKEMLTNAINDAIIVFNNFDATDLELQNAINTLQSSYDLIIGKNSTNINIILIVSTISVLSVGLMTGLLIFIKKRG